MDSLNEDALRVQRATLRDDLHKATARLDLANKMSKIGKLPDADNAIAVIERECSDIKARLALLETQLQK